MKVIFLDIIDNGAHQVVLTTKKKSSDALGWGGGLQRQTFPGLCLQYYRSHRNAVLIADKSFCLWTNMCQVVWVSVCVFVHWTSRYKHWPQGCVSLLLFKRDWFHYWTLVPGVSSAVYFFILFYFQPGFRNEIILKMWFIFFNDIFLVCNKHDINLTWTPSCKSPVISKIKMLLNKDVLYSFFSRNWFGF